MNFVVKYFKNNEFLGYHLSTFCQYSKDITRAKVYTTDDIPEQIKTIRSNLAWLMNAAEEKDRDTYYEFGLDIDKVDIQHEFVDAEPKPLKIWGKVDESGNIVNI